MNIKIIKLWHSQQLEYICMNDLLSRYVYVIDQKLFYWMKEGCLPEEPLIQVTRGHRKNVNDIIFLLFGFFWLWTTRKSSERDKERTINRQML